MKYQHSCLRHSYASLKNILPSIAIAIVAVVVDKAVAVDNERRE